MMAALLVEGYGALRDGRGASEHRVTTGLERNEFVNCMLVGGMVTMLSIVAPELSGMSALMDRAMGDKPSSLILGWPMLPAIAAAISLMTALMVWKGPYLAERLARLLGGQASLMAAAIWLYLATAATTVISIVIIAFDVFGGLASELLPEQLGLFSLAAALISLIASIAISAALAQHLLGLRGIARSLVFAMVWLVGLLCFGFAMWASLFGLLGGGSS